MGLEISTFVKINEIINKSAINKKKVLEIGAQNLVGNFNDVRISEILEPLCDEKIEFRLEEYARKIYKLMGFEYTAIDYSGEDDCLSLDLNYENLPNDYKKSFDLVTNIGTTEHIFNQYNCFKVIHDATELNGIMIHVLPMNGCFEHGFYNYQPNLFFSLALANQYEVLDVELLYSSQEKNTYRNTESKLINLEAINNYKDINEGGDLGLLVAFRRLTTKEFSIPQQNIYTNSKKKYYQTNVVTYLDKLHELSLWGVDKKSLLNVFEGKMFVLYGAGGISENIMSVRDLRKHIVAIADVDKNKQNSSLHGVDIISPDEIAEYSINILVTIDINNDSIVKFIKEKAGSNMNIHFLNEDSTRTANK